MATFLLRWNPEISSFTEEDFSRYAEHFPFCDLDWSIYDYKKANAGDDFYMMRVGDEYAGIVMAGRLLTTPMKGDHWDGSNRDRFYTDLQSTFVVDPTKQPYITLEMLNEICPEVDWNNGHSGVLLNKATTAKLQELWNSYKKNNRALFERIAYINNLAIEPQAAKIIRNFDIYKNITSLNPVVDPLSQDITHDCANIGFEIDYPNSLARLSVWFLGEKKLTLTCKRLHRVFFQLFKNIPLTGSFTISNEFANTLHLHANGIEIICDSITFESVTDFDESYLPSTI